MVSEEVMTSVRDYLSTLPSRGIDVSFGVLYGSYVTGFPHKWSDIDLIVVAPRFDVTRERGDVDTLWRVAARTDTRIEPIPCGERQWYEDDSSAIIEIARREGVKIYPGESDGQSLQRAQDDFRAVPESVLSFDNKERSNESS